MTGLLQIQIALYHPSKSNSLWIDAFLQGFFAFSFARLSINMCLRLQKSPAE